MTTEQCPRCPSNAYVDGVCSTCGYNARYVPLGVLRQRAKSARVRRRLRAKRAACGHAGGKAFVFVEKRHVGDAYLDAERCRLCGEERLVEVEGAR